MVFVSLWWGTGKVWRPLKKKNAPKKGVRVFYFVMDVAVFEVVISWLSTANGDALLPVSSQ